MVYFCTNALQTRGLGLARPHKTKTTMKKKGIEIKEWKTQTSKFKVSTLLISDGVAFRFNEEDGIIFSAPENYVKNMIRRLMDVYGVDKRPVIEEV